MWSLIFASVALLAMLGIAFLMSRALRFGFCKKLYQKNKILGILSSLWPIIICLPFLFISSFACIIALLHLFVFWVVIDVIAFVCRKLAKKERREKYINGFIAITLAAVYLIYGWIMAHAVFQTDYTVKTAKNIGGEALRIAAIADAHIGVTLDGDEFADECKRINAQKPDVAFVCGDFVDDDSPRTETEKACRALGTIDAKYGVYFVFGNHDRGYFTSKSFSEEELITWLTESGVKVLRDDAVMINENICVIGREDAAKRERKSAEELMAWVDKSKFVIILDHQPNDYDALEKSSADLVISGHTHGGHVFPAGQIGMLIGANDMLYGHDKRGNTDFIVTSGISGWAIPFKTFAISEFLIIDVKN